jgi:transketolase
LKNFSPAIQNQLELKNGNFMNTSYESLSQIANRLRILSIEETTRAGSGHPTSCCSAADIVSALFFEEMRFDPSNPHAVNNDRFILSKGHAAPLLYAAWEETGHVTRDQIMGLRTLGSDFEGHPTPRLDFVDVATGSLGQGLAAGVGMAINAKMDSLSYRTYVMMGDGECAEGSVWEAASLAGVRKLNNLVAIVDCNRLGQSQATAFGHDVEIYRNRFEAFGWKAVTIDGHDMEAILVALEAAKQSSIPFAIIAKTIKGKGIEFAADKLDWHGKALSEEEAKKAIAALTPKSASGQAVKMRKPEAVIKKSSSPEKMAEPSYEKGKKVATRKAFGNALARVGAANPQVVVLDGDVENSTHTLDFGKKFPERFVECFIAEQTIAGASVGLASQGKIPVASTFAAFFTRAYDQIRMAAVSFSNMKLCGTHCGVSIGEDGPSQMGLEDISMMRSVAGSIVLHPCDAISTERLVEKMIATRGMVYLRTARPETPIIYDLNEKFEIGGAKVLKQSDGDQVTIVAAGVTVFEALKAYETLQKEGISVRVIDAYSIKPLARDLILASARDTDMLVITVEDHFIEGGLGDAVAGELSSEGVRVHKLAVSEVPHSGKEMELLAKYKIDSKAIIEKVKEIAKNEQTTNKRAS